MVVHEALVLMAEKGKTLDDAACLAQIQHGGRAAQQGVTMLYQRYASRFLRYGERHYGFTQEEAEDVVQNAFVNIVRVSGTTREVASVSAWLWRIAINCANDAVRRKRPELSVAERFAPDDEREEQRMDGFPAVSSDKAPDDGLIDCVRRAFRAFAADHPERAHALALVTIEGWSSQELATYLGRTYGATREYVSQCRARLRPYLLQRCQDYLA